jgi:PAT family beta-lactamase induction signal transducer AmpG
MSDAAPQKLSTWQSLRTVTGSWRLLAVALLSFSSGLPLGLVWIAIPTWMKQEGFDIRVVGLLALSQAPWSFKFLWSPLMDRFPLPWLGRKRGWILASQATLFALGLLLSTSTEHPTAGLIGILALATAFAAATQDIAIDAYAVEVLRKEEHGMAVGARIAFYRAAMLLAGGSAITYAGSASWARAYAGLALAYLPLMVVTWLAPEPEVVPDPPRTLREAVWGPFMGFLRQHRALDILAFVFLYKLSENLAQALVRPFLVQAGFSAEDVGIGTAVVGMAATLGGTFLGGLWTRSLGLGRALWIFGILQMSAHIGYAAVAVVGVNRPLMYAAQGLEMGTSGLATGAFSVLLLRLTQKRFSATQYALLSSLFSVSRVLTGPVAGVAADALGWRDFFILSVFAGIPGLLMLARFVPWGGQEPEFHVAQPASGPPLRRAALLVRAALGGLLGWGMGLLVLAGLGAFKELRAGRPFDMQATLLGILVPHSLEAWTTAAGLLVVGAIAALATAATLAARHGMGSPPE